MEPQALASAAASAELIVNCTTIGMTHEPDEQLPLLPWDKIPAAALVNDLVYNPMETPLLTEASRAGARTLGGIHMLVFQGAASFEIWTGLEVPIPIMLEAAIRAMEVRSKIL
jgi:shikimate dehydrogenase